MLDKSIESGSEHRKPYRKAKAVDRTCRNHGSCPWCTRNRTFDHGLAKEAEREARLATRAVVDEDLS